MATLRQIKANRRNAQLSTGPRSVEGKAVSRLNALKSGIDAQLPVITGEDPATPEVRANEWLLRRLRHAEAEVWDELLGSFQENHRMLGKVVRRARETMTRLRRRIDSVERNYHRALKELQRLQADTSEIGSVPSIHPQPALKPPDSEPKTPTMPVRILLTPPGGIRLTSAVDSVRTSKTRYHEL